MATPTEIWDKILMGDVEKDDPLWKEYVDKAAVFDKRMLDELNKIVDVILVYVAIFMSITTSFILQVNTQFKRDPADITNDLLKVMYIQMIAQSNNNSIPPADPDSFFQQSKADHDAAVIQNALLYTSLSISILVSLISLVSKLWLVNYNHQAFSVGSPYGRAMKRQEAYNSVQVWSLGGIINILPVLLLIALLFFEIYVYMSISAAQGITGFAVAVLLNVGVLFLGFTSLGGAFVPGCPFRSALSSAIRFIFYEMPSTLLKWILLGRNPWKWFRLVWFEIFVAMAAASMLVMSIKSGVKTGIWLSLYFLIVNGFLVALASHKKENHKPQRYKTSHLALWVFLPYSVIMAIILSRRIPEMNRELNWTRIIGLVVTYIAMSIVFSAIMMYVTMSKSMADTGEIDAIAWLLKTASPPNSADFFRKAGQMTVSDSIGSHYRPRLLESLMPFLSLLIISHHAPELPSSDSDTQLPSSSDEDPHLENLEIYIACLARLSDFTDSEGWFMCLWEDKMQHPELEKPLVDKLVLFANLDPRHRFYDGLRSAATKVLNNYELDMEGKSVGVPARSPSRGVLRNAVSSVATFFRNAASWMLVVSGLKKEQGHLNLGTQAELEPIHPRHWSGDIEEADSGM